MDYIRVTWGPYKGNTYVHIAQLFTAWPPQRQSACAVQNTLHVRVSQNCPMECGIVQSIKSWRAHMP